MTSNNRFGFTNNPLGGTGGGIKLGKGFQKRDVVDDPTAGIEWANNAEEDSKKELDAVAQGFRQRRDQEDKRVENATDSRYYFVVCFRDRPDRDSFLSKLNMGLDDGDWWINGYELGRMLGPEYEIE